MSLSDWASIGSLVSSIAVLISLIYLALQVRQAERNQQASIRQGRATRMVDIILAAGEPVETGFAAQKRRRHAVHVAGLRRLRCVVVGMGIEPHDEQRSALFVPMARDAVH